MLRDAGVRAKLLAVLAIPTLLLVLATGLLVGNQVAAARKAGQVNALTDVAVQINRVVHSLQQERSATLEYLQAPTAGKQAQMAGQRRYVDQQLGELRTKVAESPIEDMSESISKAAAASAVAHTELQQARASIDARRFYATEADVFYTRVIQTDLRLPGVVAESGTAALAQRLRAYEAVSTAIEYASHERDLLQVAYLRGNLLEADYAQLSALIAQQRQALQGFQQVAPRGLALALDNNLAEADNFAVDTSRRHAVDLLKGGQPDLGGSTAWLQAANTRISPMVSVETRLVIDIAETAEATQGEESRQAFLFGGIAVFGLGLALVLAFGLANRISRPLRRLTVAAGEIGDELPHMVERMQTPGEGPGVEVEPIPVESRDEIGQLAEAFNTVNEVTLRVAREQAALRASIAEMFVNVARRNQVLLGRQLAQIDQMEAREEDPDVLDNLFRLDHLATRMRRNAESLLVLAGIDATRRLRNPLPLSDVVRTAVGEIEAFDRIDLSLGTDPEVSGRLALTTAHLLAELLENATHFSNPSTRVVVAAAATGHGVDLAITDYGLGMSDEELAAANDRIANPPVAEIAVSQRLGLFVVGRLAQRLGATATLRRGRVAGTVVTVSLPTTAFMGMEPAVPEPVAAEPEPVDEPTVTAGVVPEPVGVADAAPDSVSAGADFSGPEAVSAEVDGPGPVREPAAGGDEPQPSRGRRGLTPRLPRGRRPAGTPAETPIAAAELASGDVEAPNRPRATESLTPQLVPGFPAGRLAEPERPDSAPGAVDAAPEAPAESVSATEPATPTESAPTPEPEPALQGSAATEPRALPAATAAPAPESQPRPPFAYTPAIDVLPGRPMTSRSPARPAPDPTPVPVTPHLERPRRAPANPSAADAAAPAPAADAAAPAAPAVDAAAPAAPAVDAAARAPAVDPAAPAAQPAAQAAPSRASSPAPVPQQVRPAVAEPPAPPVVVTMPRPTLPPRPASGEPAADGQREPAAEMERLAAAAQMHSNALSELRGLYEPSYRPATAGGLGAKDGLTRRTPKATPADPAMSGTTEPPRTRTAAEVRGMLSGFRAGVERGRSEPPAAPPVPTPTTDHNS